MKIAIIGAGNVGTALKTGLSRTGHEVSTVGREDNAAQAAEAAELVILAVPFAEVGNVASQLASAASGKIVIDATNALSPTMELAVDTSTTSGAEELQKKLPGARVVKAFNTTFAAAMATGQINGEKLPQGASRGVPIQAPLCVCRIHGVHIHPTLHRARSARF